MSESKHTPGKLEAKPISGPGHGHDWVVMAGNIVIATFNRKDYPEWNKANAERLVKCWNSHDALLDACRAWEKAVTSGSLAACDLGSEMLAGEAVELTKAALELVEKGA